MSHVRIVCRMPPQPKQTDPRIKVTMVPSWMDCDVLLVGDDGRETQITHVTGFTVRCRQGEESTAVLEVAGVEVDVDAAVESYFDELAAAAAGRPSGDRQG